ncbi:response regulator transcription factor [Listeria aquatica]|uniref:Response regulator transcription factor n=1 Tax=Listeria aquatica TaxID=1494960 RepID=A0A841ZP88_9LIST|nr:LytTR family DNA-binding domain-containing protein [Listeria aquatica]MBC1521347.1 response regulator transcription factor [Listeria aquatica]
MPKIFIIEDNFLYREQLRTSVTRLIKDAYFLNFSEIQAPTNIFDFFQTLPKIAIHDNDVFILDIDLKIQFNGVDIAKAIRTLNSNCFILFFTSHPQYTLDILSEHILPFSYILKKEDLLAETFHELEKTVNSINNFIKIRVSSKGFLHLKIDSTVVNIPYSDIILIQTIKSSRGTVDLITKSGRFVFNQKISELKKQIDTPFLYTGLNSIILNINEITYISKIEHLIQFANGLKIEVGIRIINKVKKYIQSLN